MKIHFSIASLKAALAQSSEIAFAPTMGNLHEGHLSLMRTARKHGKTVVSSIFVNRLQFGPNEDFERYPRTFEEDSALLESVGVDHLFAPNEEQLYPQPQRYYVQPASEHDSILEGAYRPGHFRGVATVVAKLFNIVQPDVALFGKKDYQQLLILKNMVRDLNIPIKVVGCDIIRSTDGLALSSRNAYLTKEQRIEAPRLYATLRNIAEQIKEEKLPYKELETSAINTLNTYGWKTDYIAIRRQEDLLEPEHGDPLVIVAAARLGNTRLIDNIEIN